MWMPIFILKIKDSQQLALPLVNDVSFV